MKRGIIQNNRRRDAKADKIRQTVQFRTKAGRSLEQARNPAIEPVEHRGNHNRDQRRLDMPLDRQTDPRQARGERKQRDQIRQKNPQRHRPKTLGLRFFVRLERREQISHCNL